MNAWEKSEHRKKLEEKLEVAREESRQAEQRLKEVNLMMVHNQNLLKEAKRYQRQRKFAKFTAIFILIFVPLNIFSIVLAFYDDKWWAYSDFLTAFLNLVTLIFMIATNEFIKDTGGWNKDKSLRRIRIPFWILILVNMSFLAKYIVELWGAK